MLNSGGMGEDFLLQVIVEGYFLVNNFVDLQESLWVSYI